MEERRLTEVLVICSHHPEEVLLHLSTFDGEHWYQRFGSASFIESITSSQEEFARFAEGAASFNAQLGGGAIPPTMATEAGTPTGAIWHLRCPRASCGTDIQFGARSRAGLKALTLGAWREGATQVRYTERSLARFIKG